MRQYAHTAWTVRDSGLPSGPRTITQTTDGYLWIGTDTGVLRFDGVRFVSWDPQNSALPSRQVLKLVGGADGTLWVGTAAGLARWDGREMKVIPSLQGVPVPTLFEDRDGTLWAGTDPGMNGAARVCAIRGVEARCEGNREMFGGYISAIYEDRDHDLWIASMAGLWQWSRHTRIDPAVQGVEFHSLARFDDSLLVSINREIDQIENSALRPSRLSGLPTTIKPTFLLTDRDGALWLGTQDAGLLHTFAGHMDSFTPVDGLSGSFVRDLFEDREGDVWVATPNGLDRFRAFTITRLSVHEGLSTDTVYSVLAARDGGIWVATAAGLNKIDGGTVTAMSAWTKTVHDVAGALFEDHNHVLWASSPQGVAYQRGDDFVFVDGIPAGHVLAMTEDPSGVWISHQENGLYRAKDGRVRAVTSWNDLGGRPARALAFDAHGRLWMAFADGALTRCESDLSGCHRIETPALGTNASFFIESDDTVWIASETGLLRYAGAALTTFGEANGLPCNSVDWITRDRSGAFWLATACGLVRLGAETKAAKADAKLNPDVFDTSDGVISRASLGGYGPKVTISQSGQLWFTDTNGVEVFDPARIQTQRYRPPVHIEQVVVDRVAYDAQHEVRVPSSSRDIRIEYTASELAIPERQRFLYKLEGRDTDWIDAGTRREAFYTDLRPGTYHFRVIALVGRGTDGNADVRAITIIPSWYETMTFRIGVGILIVLAVWSMHRLRLRRLAGQLDVRFADRLSERTRIAQHLHDTLLQDFVSISMQLHAVTERSVDPEAKSRLAGILARLSEVIEDSRRTVQGLHSARPHEQLETRLTRDAEALRGDRQIELDVTVKGTCAPINPVVADEVYYIAREALANALTHARATRIEVAIEYAESELLATVADNGVGIPDNGAPAEGHLGLTGMHRRAESIGATLRISSRPSGGTAVTLIVPATIAYSEVSPHSTARRTSQA